MAGDCHASGAWRGDKKSKNSNVVTPTQTGTLIYALECIESINSSNHRSRTMSVTLNVNAAAGFTLASVDRATAVEYEFTTIDVPGADRTEAYGINNAGQIVGLFFDATGQHGFMKDGDDYVVIDVGLDGTSAFGINDVQQIVGFASDQGFLKDGDNVQSIAIPSSNFTVAWDINNVGSVAGTFNDDFGTHGFFKDGDNVIPIDGPEALFTEATGINDSGEIVGNYISSAGSFQAFKTIGWVAVCHSGAHSDFTEARDINQLGHVVGSFVDPDGVVHGFVLSDTEISIVDAPDAASPNFTQAKGINDAGSLVGWFDEGGGKVHGFLAIPVGKTVVAIDIAPGKKQDAINPKVQSPDLGRHTVRHRRRARIRSRLASGYVNREVWPRRRRARSIQGARHQ